MVIEIIVSFIVGVFSNITTHFILKAYRKRKGPSVPSIGWLEVLGWSILPILFPLSALWLVKYRWPLTLVGKIVLLVVSFLIPAGLLAGRKYLTLVIIVESPVQVLIFGVVIAICVFFLLDQKLPNFIALDCPSDVKGKETLRGRIIDPKWRVYVMLRPLGVQGTFVNPAPPPGKDGTWYATVYFGGGEGEKFEVYALALSPDKDLLLKPSVPPESDWLEKNAQYKTSICVVAKR